MTDSREVMEVDVLFVGGGIASLSSALHLSNLIKMNNDKAAGDEKTKPLDQATIAVLEKAAFPGSHGISGAVMDPGPLGKLVPDFIEKGAPLDAEVGRETVYFLTKNGKTKIPLTSLPDSLNPLANHGNYIVSASRLAGWLAGLAEGSGVDIFPGFAGVEVLYDGDRVIGVRTGDKGIGADGGKKANYEPGIDLHAKVTVFGEGSRGSLTKTLIKRFNLDKGRNPSGFEVGVKEVWEVPDGRIEPGEVIHTMGYPLKNDTFGGGFIYGMNNNKVAVGQLTSLNYRDSFIDPHREFQKFKSHPLLKDLLQDGKLLQYGAKTVPVGGYFSVPELCVDGGLIIGDSANLFNSQKIKGIHLAMASGMLAAETIFECMLTDDFSKSRLDGYQKAVFQSGEVSDLYKVRNFHQTMEKGLFSGMFMAGIQFLLGGRGIFKSRIGAVPDHLHLEKIGEGSASGAGSGDREDDIKYDGKLTFDKETDVYYSDTTHEEDQPSHLKIIDLDLCYTKCTREFQNPCVRFCPAGVYEMELDQETGKQSMKLNFSNCVHCKTCDIKDPYENITWVPPEGGGGPKYTMM